MHLDTHAVLWLHESGVERFPEAGRDLLRTESLIVSPMVELELGFLGEVGKVSRTPREILSELSRSVALRVSSAPFRDVVSAAESLTWTRDPFDRLICADALVCGASLLTKDRTIRAHLDGALWD